MNKLAIVMSNYIDVDCDANTASRQAYERGFLRAAEKCEAVMRSRKIENDKLKSENAKLREQSERLFDKTLEVATENAKLRNACYGLLYAARAAEVAMREALIGPNLASMLCELGIEVQDERA